MSTLFVVGVALGAVVVIALHQARRTEAVTSEAGETMVPLMPKRTFLVKWVVPFAVIALILGWQIQEELTKPEPDYLLVGVMSVVLLIVFFFALRRQYKNVPDEVLDGGTFLRVSCGNETEDIPISNLRAVETGKLLTTTKIALVLRVPSRFGDLIAFYPHQKKDTSGRNAVAFSLQRRVDGSLSS